MSSMQLGSSGDANRPQQPRVRSKTNGPQRSIAITMDIYCHWMPGEGRDGLEEALGGQNFVRNRVRKTHIIAYHKKRLQ